MISLILLKLFTFSQILQGVPKLSHATVYIYSIYIHTYSVCVCVCVCFIQQGCIHLVKINSKEKQEIIFQINE